MRRLFWLLPMFVLAAGCKQEGGQMGQSSGPSAAGAKEYTLRFQPKEGDTVPYNMTIVTTQGDKPQEMSMDMTYKVKKAEGDKYTIEVTMERMKAAGQEFTGKQLEAMGQKMSFSMVMDKTGKTIESQAGGPGDSTPGASFPEHPVKVGDSWKSTVKAGKNDVEATYKLEGIEQMGGVETAHITATMPETDEVKPDGPIHVWVDTADGMIRKVELKGQGKAAAGNPMSGKVTMTMTRRG